MRIRASVTSLLSSVAAMGTAAGEAAAQSETAQADTPLPAVVVTAPRPSLTVPSIGDARKEIDQTPGGVEVIDSKEYRDGRATSLKDMLDFTPGVLVQSKYGQEDSKLSIRGSGLSRNFHVRGVRLLLDGAPVNQADGSGDFQEIDPLAQEYIEVYKGANALRYGAATLGGAINFVSPTGRSQPGFMARLYAGSFGTFGQQLAGGFQEGPWDAWLTVTNNHSDGWRMHTQEDYVRFNGNVGAQAGGNAETRFFVSGNYIRNAIPGSLTQQQFQVDPRMGPYANVIFNTRRDIDSFRVSNRTVIEVGNDQVTLSGFAKAKSLFHPLTFGIVDNDLFDWGATAQYKGTRQIGRFRDEFLAGVNYFGGTNRNKLYANNFGVRGALTNDVTEKSGSVEAYGENRFYVVPDVALVAGLQLNWASRVLYDNFPGNGNDSGARDYLNANPKFGVLWQASEQIQVFANYSRASEPPAWSELNPSAAPGFANLAPQTSWTLEIGTRGKLGDRLGLDLSLYRAWVKDELQLLVVPGFGNSPIATNVPQTSHQGIELGLDGRIADRLTGRLAYTFSDFRFDNNPVYGNNRLPGAPPHYIRAEVLFAPFDGFHVGPNLEWVPEGYYADNVNNPAFKTSPYALLGLKAGYTGFKGIDIFLDARNLTDTRYVSNTNAISVANAASQLYNPGDGLAVYAGVQARF